MNDLDLNPHRYAHLHTCIQVLLHPKLDGKKTAYSTNAARKTGYLHADNLKVDPCL
jgi:hypothetical protein